MADEDTKEAVFSKRVSELEERINEEMFKALKRKYEQFRECYQAYNGKQGQEKEESLDQLLEVAEGLDEILQTFEQRQSDEEDLLTSIKRDLDEFEKEVQGLIFT